MYHHLVVDMLGAVTYALQQLRTLGLAMGGAPQPCHGDVYTNPSMYRFKGPG